MPILSVKKEEKQFATCKSWIIKKGLLQSDCDGWHISLTRLLMARGSENDDPKPLGKTKNLNKKAPD